MSWPNSIQASNRRYYLLMAALVAALCWITSLSADVDVYAFSDSRYDDLLRGWALLLFGWLFGPLGLTIAWYANVSLLVCICMMLSGRTPNFRFASASLGLALTGLLPMYVNNNRWRGWPSCVARRCGSGCRHLL